MGPEPENTRQLPRFGREAELERLSIRAFDNLLPVDQFIFRGEHKEDAGVDGELEVLIAPNFTNFRAKVQLKATDDGKINQDGSYSLNGVFVSSFEYLLNGLSPFYVLLIVPLNQLRYAWAWEEFRRHEEKVPGWKTQGTITINFKNTLDADSLQQIRERIILESNFKRQVHETLGRSGDAELVSLHVNPQTLAITDPVQVRTLLVESGISLVGSGHGKQIIELARLLNPADVHLPRIQVVLAYAHFTQSRLLATLGHIQEALISQSQLTPEDRDFLIFLRDGCDHESGRITLAEYAQRKEKWSETAKSSFSLIHQLECLGHELVSDLGSDKFSETLAQLRSTVQEIENDSRSSTMLKLQARLKLKYADGAELIRSFMGEVEILHVRTSINRTANPLATLELLLDRYLQWQGSLQELFDAVLATDHKRILGDLTFTRGILQFNFLSIARYINVPGEFVSFSSDLLEKAIVGVRLSMDLYQRSGYLLGEIRSKMLLTDFLVLAGRELEAKTLASETLPIAQAMGFPNVEEHITGHIEGKSMLANADACIEQGKLLDLDIVYAAECDERIRLFAKAMHAGLSLPDDRYPIVERECFANREAARETVSWCRHFGLIQDLTHTKRFETQYASDPVRFGVCNYHHIVDNVGSVDSRKAIDDFKREICSQCSDRLPKAISKDLP